MRRVLGIFLCEIFACLGKRGELRCGGVLLAPKPSSFSKALKCLSSPVLPFFIGLFLWVAPISTQAAICFLPDCKDKKMEFVQTGADVCVSSGYYSILDVTCSQYSKTEFCPENTSYIKCDNVAWCQENGYNTTECSVPQYVSDQCPNGEALYRECVDDFARACSDLNSEYVLECEVGYTKSEGGECPYSSDYGKCCNLCEDFPYLASEIGQGYLLGDSCEACGEVTKYKRVVNPCAGYMSCPEGGKTGASTCWHGEDKWYSECCSPCEAYDYTIDTIPQGYVAGASCDSCTGMKYMLAEGRCAEGYEWKNGTCVACVASCGVGNILYSDMTCNSCIVEGKTAIGIVIKENELVVALNMPDMKWSNSSVNVVGITETTDSSVAKQDYAGKENTLAIVSTFSNETASNNAGVYCNAYSTTGTVAGNWFLPSMGQVFNIYNNYGAVKTGWDKVGSSVPDDWFWTSSEYSDEYAWNLEMTTGDTGHSYGKSVGYHTVACVAGFEIGDDGKPAVCAPEYMYLCTPDEEKNITGGSGEACAGMYTKCACVTGATWQDGACVCDDTCAVGNILYSDMTCNSCLISGKNSIGVIIKENELAMNKFNASGTSWATSYVDVSGIANMESSNLALQDYNGKTNTLAIVAAYTANTASNNAAVYCNSFVTEGTEAGNWYLPAFGEYNSYAYGNWGHYSKINATLGRIGTALSDRYMWTSTEVKSDMAWFTRTVSGAAFNDSKTRVIPVGCFLGIHLEDDGSVGVCDDTYLYPCKGTGYKAGVGEVCGVLYESCECELGYEYANGKCTLCDMKYVYSCLGENQTAGVGDSCGGLYEACTCDSRYEWDTANGICTKCGDEFVYDCTPDEATNIVGGSGDTCDGMYASCSCVTGAIWQNGACVCDDTCSVGNILYSDYSCSACLYDDRTPIGVIVKNDGTTGAAIALGAVERSWASDTDNISLLNDYSSPEVEDDFSGKENTKIIADFYGNGATVDNNAAVYCYNYTTSGTSAHQWYLPAVGELRTYYWGNFSAIQSTYNKLSLPSFIAYYWSSSEAHVSGYAWYVDASTDAYSNNPKTLSYKTNCMLSFNLNGVGEVDICDGDYLYACDGENMSGGADTGCGGLYKSCECDSGYTAYKGLCCDMTCAVGNIMYSDMTCSSCLITEKTPIGVVVKSDGANSLVMSNRTGNIQWGGYGTDISTLTNYSSDTVAKTDFSGKDNTAKIVAHFGENVDTSLHAGVFCHKYVTEGTNAGNWYLPAAGELYSYVYGNYNELSDTWTNKLAASCSYDFWSSSEEADSGAWVLTSSSGLEYSKLKYNISSVTCFLGVSIGDDGKAEVCENTYLYPCVGTGYASGVGESCGGLYSACTCEIGYDYADGKCTLCDAKYVYACVGEYQTSGVGEGCGGLYEACECEDGYGFKDGVCGLCEDTFTFECVSNGTDNITGGAGESCSGKYEACSCSEGYEFTLGQCCDNTCKVGNILYSDMTCSSCVFDSKTPIGVVVKENELVASLDLQYQYWADDYLNISGITEITDSSVAQVDMRGKEHTIAIVTDYGTEVDVSSNAGVYCYNYAPVGMESIKNQWYLPSAGELYEYFYGDGINYAKINEAWTKLGISWTSVWFWTSSEYSDDSAWRVNYSTGQITPNDKDSYTSSVSCLLGINVGGDGSVEVCDPEYMYTCDGTNASGVGEACGGLYKSCECANDTGWYINDCVDCDETKYKYSCTVGTGNITAGVGYSCGGLYESCECDSGYYWDSATGACVGCDAKYQYTCESTGSDNIVGTGEECGGFYSTCLCADGYGWENGACVTCVDTCEVGHILYSDMTCSSCVLPNKTAIGIVVKDNELVMSNRTGSIQWGGRGTDISTLTNYGSSTDAQTDFNGKENTAKLVAHFGEDVDTTLHAGVFCYKYTTEGTNAGDWYLPAAGELYSYVYRNYNSKLKATATKLGWDIAWTFWSLSEISTNRAWSVGSSNGNVYGGDKSNSKSVSCFLPVSVGDDGKVEVCDNIYLYACNGTGYAGGSGEGCGGLYTACSCAAGYEWIDGACVACGDTYKYACSADAATFTTGGAGESCGGLYESCECSTGYGWSADDESCAACDEKYQYACTPDETAHIVGGGDDTCGGSYSACECAEGYAWSGTQCCSTTCTVGAILYSDMTCSECLFADKTPIGVVVKDNELVMSQNSGTSIEWSSGHIDTSLTNYSSSTDARTDFNGKSNTAAIVVAHPTDTVDNNAAIYCNSYSIEGSNAGNWYLPAAGEIYSYVYGGGTNYNKINTTMGKLGWTFNSNTFRSSSEQNSDYVWSVSPIDGHIEIFNKSNNYSDSCFLNITLGDDGKIEVCDSSYKYACAVGTVNVTVGEGEICGGLYKSCACAEGYQWFSNDGVYQCCDMSCSVGNILYSDMTCSACKIDGKTPIGIVVKDNELVMSNGTRSIQWGGYGTDINTLTNYTSEADAKTDFNGKINTTKIVSHFGEDVDTTLHAGVFCHKYTTEGTNAGDWYLPAAGELSSYVSGNYSSKLQPTASKLRWQISDSFWSSSEYGYYKACTMYVYNGAIVEHDKRSYYLVSCFLNIALDDDGNISICDSKYVYMCSGGNATEGVGETCGGYYESCTCAEGYEWYKNGVLAQCCDMSCSVGNILYSDMTCSECKLDGKTPIGVIVRNTDGNAAAMSIEQYKAYWSTSSDYADISEITNNTSSSNAKTDYNGMANTEAIVAKYGTDADEATHAGVYCYNYETEGTTSGQWYLPAAGEWRRDVWDNYSILSAKYSTLGSNYLSNSFWLSSEYNSYRAWYAYYTSSSNYDVSYGYKYDLQYYVNCFLPFQVGEDGSIETCESSYKYACSNSTGTIGGTGESCGGHYESCECASGYYWSGTACTKCDAKYQYECVADADAGIVGGGDNQCGGMYSICECAEGYGWENGECLACDSSCSIGNILFSDGTCSRCNLSSKTPIGVIGYEAGTKKLAVALENKNMTWAPQNRDVPTLTNITSSSTAKTDYNGKYNTKSILEYYGKNTAGVAARYCYNYVTSGTTAGQWYLPAMGELYDILYSNRTAINNRLKWMDMTQLPSTSSDYYWSSTEYSSDYAWYFYSTSSLSYTSKLNNYIAQCVIPFEDKDDGTAKICGAEYQYECVYDEVAGVLGGVGDTCIGMYSSCECSDGREYINGKCCDNTCEVGNILYSDMTCSSCKIDGKIPVGVVAYASGTTRMAIDLENMKGKWSPDTIDIPGLNNYTSTSTGDMKGKANTRVIVDYYGKNAEDVAAVACYNHKTTDWDEHLWYLPADNELELITTTSAANAINQGFATLGKNGINVSNSSYSYWSSTEYKYNNSYYALYYYQGQGVAFYNSYKKNTSKYFKCMLSFEEHTTGKADVCNDSYTFTCTGTNETPKGVACGGKYKECSCANGTAWNGTACVKCDSTYKYYCDGPNQVGGSKKACGGLYEICECAEGYSWRNGKCEDCSADCAVGDIVYSDLTCSGCVEEGKTPVAVIMHADGESRIAVALDTFKSQWSEDTVNIVGIPNEINKDRADINYLGKQYTQAIVKHYGADAKNNAGVACYNYAPEGVGEHSWYLPSYGEFVSRLSKVKMDVNKGLRLVGEKDLFPMRKNTDDPVYLTSLEYYSELETSERNIWVYANEGGCYLRNYKNIDENNVLCMLPLGYTGNQNVKVCGEEYKYTCSGGAYVGGEGDFCGGYYRSCECAEGYENYKGDCCTSVCAYGHYYYSDNTCNSCLVDEKTVIGFLVDDFTVVGLDVFENSWSSDYASLDLGSDYDMAGKANTLALVKYYGEAVTGVAAVDCYNYETEGTSAGQWYLPSHFELYHKLCYKMQNFMYEFGYWGVDLKDDGYWTSSNKDYAKALIASSSKSWCSDWPEMTGVDKSKQVPFFCYLNIEYNKETGKAPVCDNMYNKSCYRSSYMNSNAKKCGSFYSQCNCYENNYGKKYGEYISGCEDCGSKYKYKCLFNAEKHIVGGEWYPCGGLYEACECEDGYTWNEGACVFGTPVVPENPDTPDIPDIPTSCSDDYKYECLGEGYIGGSGTSCDNLYASCECVEGYKWENGECVSMCEHGYVMVDGVCICDTSCAVGNILYSDMSCSGCVVENKMPIGIIAIAKGNARYAWSINAKTTAYWSKDRVDIVGLKNYQNSAEAVKDFSGKLNTKVVMDYYATPSSSYIVDNCYNYITRGTYSGQWYLPALGEIKEARNNKVTLTAGLLEMEMFNQELMSSTEISSESVWGMSKTGSNNTYSKTSSYSYRCMLPLEMKADNKLEVSGSEYLYRCDALGQVGAGDSCGGMYKSCTCIEGFEEIDGKCCSAICKEGTILYSDGTCNTCVLADKTAIGVVAYANEGSGRLVTALDAPSVKWSSNSVNIANLNNSDGKSNTQLIVDYYGTSVASTTAAVKCYNYTTTGTSVGQWYLPAKDELFNIWDNIYTINGVLTELGKTNLGVNSYHWTSTQNGSSYAYYVYRVADNYSNPGISSSYNYKTTAYKTLCVMAVEDNGDGTINICSDDYKYSCQVANASGKGEACGGLYKACECADGKAWYVSSCIDCDETYKYACTSSNETAGIGETCGGLYTSCTCTEGMEWSEELGKCITDCETDYVWDDEQNKCVFDSCPVGSIYYSDGTCSLAVDSAKTAIGVVWYKEKSKRLVVALTQFNSYASGNIVEINGSLGRNDYAGKRNTKLKVENYGADYANDSGVACYNYVTDGTTIGNWYLPAAGELYDCFEEYNTLNTVLSKIGGTNIATNTGYYSSSEYGNNEYSSSYFGVTIYSSGVNLSWSSGNVLVRCMLQVEDNGNGTAKVCDVEYLSSCEGDGYIGGVGEDCGEMYAECECAENYEYYKGRCCDTRCVLGNILYSDGSCSSCRIAGKTPIGIVAYEVGDRRLVINVVPEFSGNYSGADKGTTPFSVIQWSADKEDIVDLTNYTDYETSILDDSGELNTQLIVENYEIGDIDNAAGYCHNYIGEGIGGEWGKWYLPSLAELKTILTDNKDIINVSMLELEKEDLQGTYWSSTEHSSDYAWFVDADSNDIGYNDKDYNYVVACVLPIDVGDDGVAKVCDDTYLYSCVGDNMIGGVGEACGGFYKDCQCADGYGSYMGKCITCDSRYQYSCEGEHIVEGIGYGCGLYETCECEVGYDFINGVCISCEEHKYNCIPNTDNHIMDGKGDKCGIGYSACECEYGYVWSETDGACVCDTSCKVGYYYWENGKCNGCYYYTADGVIVYANDSEFWFIHARSLPSGFSWNDDIPYLDNYDTFENALSDMDGKINTKAIADYYAQNPDKSSTITCGGKWYAPALGEWKKIWDNRSIIDQHMLKDIDYDGYTAGYIIEANAGVSYGGTSTEADATEAYVISKTESGRMPKGNGVKCIATFELNADGSTTLCGEDYLYRCDGEHTTGVGETCAGHYKSCACDDGYGFYVKNCKICEDSFKYACSVGDNHISGGKDYPCGDLYEACECEIGYKWSGTDGACVPCGAEYQYECTVDATAHIAGGGEDSCSIYYSSCSCDFGYVWSDAENACICDTSCSVGNILYSDGTCNGCVLEDKTIVGVVGYLGDDNTALLLRAGMISTKWSSNNVDIPGLKTWTWNDITKDVSGKSNTQIIVDYYGEDATDNAAVACYNYSTEGTEAGQWYLPATGELLNVWSSLDNYTAITNQMKALGAGAYSENMFSSTEYSSGHSVAVYWYVYQNTTSWKSMSKTSSYYAYCVLPMVINDDGSLDACDAKYKFTCEGEHIVGTVGESCGRWYEGCQCASGYVWENGYCAQTCDWEYQYECVFDELTSITGGVGEGCGGQYTACECAEGYIWSTGLEQCVSTCDIAYEWSEDESQCVCKSDYKYSCIGDKQVGGDSVNCGGSYSACECEVGYVWSNETGACECDSSCAVGEVYYSDGTCSSCVLEDKTAVGVVAYDIKGRKAIVALDSQTGYWSADNVNIPKLPDISNNTSALDDYRGKYNTSVIVEHYGNDTDTTKNAAVYCANYAPEGMEHTKGKWYLPALGELNVSVNTNGLLINNVFDALGKLYLGNVYWSSSEYGSYGVYYIKNAGGISTGSKTDSYISRCFLHIGDIEEDKPEVCSMDNQYICGSKTAGEIGEECGGLYTSCSCAEGMVFYNEECCNPKCIPGSIYYHDGTCSSCRIWERTPIGMVVNDHLVVALNTISSNWGLENIDIPELRNYATEEEAKTDFNGKVNTEILVKYYPGYAADKCNQYTTIGTEVGQWYLPAAGELFEVFTYYDELNSLLDQFNVSRSNVRMSSTEQSIRYAWSTNGNDSDILTLMTTKNNGNSSGGGGTSYFQCVMAINLNEDGISSELCSADYKYRCDGENASGVGDSCGGLYKLCTCSNGTEQFLKDCVVCEDSYKYSCEVVEDTYITGSNGWSCGGRYESCVCDDAHRWSDDEGACICDTSCSVGNILYSDGSCSSCALEDKTAVGIIAYYDGKRRLAVNLASTSMKWSSSNDDIPNLPNVVSSASGDFNGKVNTKLIVDFYGKNATDNAAGYCYNYAPEAWSETKNSWYFPAAGEVYSIIKTNKEKISKALRTLGLNEFNSSYYNTSTEYSDSKPWIVDSNGILSYYYNSKSGSYDVLCVLPIEEQDDGTVAFCGDDYVATCDVSGTSGKGEVCGDLYKSCECSNGMGWYIRECVDCADTYKYACEVTDDNGVVGGVGFSCGGLYDDCQCSVVGQRWDGEQGKCRCLDNCAIGNILYSDGTCNSCLLDDKTVVGVIVKNEDGNGLVMSKDKKTSYWSSDRSDVSGITNITSSATVQSDYNGKIYTDAIVDKYGVSASSNAGVYCYNYAPIGVENTQGQWYLPAGGEVYNYMYKNYSILENTLINVLGWGTLNYTFWTSNEYNSNYAWYINLGSGTITYSYKNSYSYYVGCMLPFEENDDGSAKICTSDYKYTCTNTNESLGSDICAGLYNKCVCAEGYYWSAEDGACLDCSGTDKFKYACAVDASTYITGGIGETCSGLYETCTCAEGYGFKNGMCLSKEDSFIYECVSDETNNIKGGKGEVYNGKYEACTCGLGYTWSGIDGVCVASSCAIGNILYSDGSCSATVDSSKTAIGVVAYDDGSLKRALALTSSSNKWSSNSVDVPNLTNYSSSSSAQGDKNGKENTRILVEYYGESSTTTAAVTCYNYTTAGTSKGDWYLGSAGEMYEVFVTNKTAVNNALSLLGKSTLASSDYWTSTEYSSSKANEIYNYKIYSNGETKTNSYKVQCMISF